MRCSLCGKNVDHQMNYSFLVDGRTVIQCDACREAYLKEQAEREKAEYREYLKARVARKLKKK